MIFRFFILIITCFAALSCQNEKSTQNFNIGFQILSEDSTGIAFENKLTSTPELNILNYLYFYNGAGVCVADLTMMIYRISFLRVINLKMNCISILVT